VVLDRFCDERVNPQVLTTTKLKRAAIGNGPRAEQLTQRREAQLGVIERSDATKHPACAQARQKENPKLATSTALSFARCGARS